MKISLNWLQDYLDLSNYSPVEIADILTEIGLEVEGTEVIESVRGGLKGIVVGQVVACQKHPNADRLSVTKVDLGNGKLHSIVCGAPNVAEGQKVLVAPIGTTLYDQEGKSFKIKKGKIRGEISEGMICAEDELGLGSDHSGIMVLPDEVEAGTLAKDHFQISQDTVFEIGLTPNRSDATSHVGVARDLHAALKVNYDANIPPIQAPDLSDWSIDNLDHPVQVQVESSEGCPRYAGITISGINVSSSPQWLQDRLSAIGVRPINNVVDITNYVLHEMGQPLHAFDLDQIEGRKIIVKTLPAGTEFITLDEQTRHLSDQDLMICDGEARGLCIAGVFGGIGSGVTGSTTDIFLESAHFNAQWIRRSSGRHLLFTDAAKVFEKGSDPNICVMALKRAALMIRALAGGSISSDIVDAYPQKVPKAEVSLRYAHLNKLIGIEIPRAEVHSILDALGIEIIHKDDVKLVAKVPTNKVDVTREADLIEEVLRIYGFNKVPLPAGMDLKIKVDTEPNYLKVQNRVSDYLVAQGFQEMMSLSLVDRQYFDDQQQLVRINNTSNLNLEVMRPDLMVSALEAVRHNSNRQQNHLRLFEFGFSYGRDGSNIIENQQLALVISGWHEDHWMTSDLAEDASFYALKSLAEGILSLLGIRRFKVNDLDDSDFAWGLHYQQKGKTLVKLGKVSAAQTKTYDVKNEVYFATFNWDETLEVMQVDQVQVQDISRYPVVRRDLSLVIPEDTTYAQIEKMIRQVGQPLIQEIQLFDIYRDPSLGAGHKSYAIALTFGSTSKTLSDQDIDKVIDDIVSRLQQDLNAQLR